MLPSGLYSHVSQFLTEGAAGVEDEVCRVAGAGCRQELICLRVYWRHQPVRDKNYRSVWVGTLLLGSAVLNLERGLQLELQL